MELNGLFLTNAVYATGYYVKLTRIPLVPHICVGESDQHWFRQWFVAYSVKSHYLNQGLIIVNWTLRNILQFNFNQNTKFPFTEIYLKLLSAKWLPGGDELTNIWPTSLICFSVQGLTLQVMHHRADTRFGTSQWETALLCNDVSRWLGASLESALYHFKWIYLRKGNAILRLKSPTYHYYPCEFRSLNK